MRSKLGVYVKGELFVTRGVRKGYLFCSFGTSPSKTLLDTSPLDDQ